MGYDMPKAKTTKSEFADMGFGKPLRVLQMIEMENVPPRMKYAVRLAENGTNELFSQFYERPSYANKKYDHLRLRMRRDNPMEKD